MIIKSGVNIYPSEIENELLKLTAIDDAMVTGQKDAIKGEIIIAYVKMKPASSFEELQIKNCLKEVLSGIKIPDKIYELTDFEYTSSGKKIKPSPAMLTR